MTHGGAWHPRVYTLPGPRAAPGVVRGFSTSANISRRVLLTFLISYRVTPDGQHFVILFQFYAEEERHSNTTIPTTRYY